MLCPNNRHNALADKTGRHITGRQAGVPYKTRVIKKVTHPLGIISNPISFLDSGNGTERCICGKISRRVLSKVTFFSFRVSPFTLEKPGSETRSRGCVISITVYGIAIKFKNMIQPFLRNVGHARDLTLRALRRQFYGLPVWPCPSLPLTTGGDVDT